jgi:hypothetical protein
VPWEKVAEHVVGQFIPGGALVIDPVPAGGGVTVSSNDGAGPRVGFVPPPQLAKPKINAAITGTAETKGRYKGASPQGQIG